MRRSEADVYKSCRCILCTLVFWVGFWYLHIRNWSQIWFYQASKLSPSNCWILRGFDFRAPLCTKNMQMKMSRWCWIPVAKSNFGLLGLANTQMFWFFFVDFCSFICTFRKKIIFKINICTSSKISNYLPRITV